MSEQDEAPQPVPGQNVEVHAGLAAAAGGSGPDLEATEADDAEADKES